MSLDVDWSESSRHPGSEPELETVIACLTNPHSNENQRRVAVLFAEILELDHEQRARILPVLAAYIDQHLFAEDDLIFTSVCSAIRKFAMNLPSDQLDRYSVWLRPSVTKSLKQDVELELVKAVANRFSYSMRCCAVF